MEDGVGIVVKNPYANARDPKDEGSILGPGRTPGGGHGRTLAWEIPWTEEPGGLPSMGLQKESDMTGVAERVRQD